MGAGVPHEATAPSEASREQAMSFGSFRLLATQRLLLEGDRPVRLGSRALDILIALVTRAGELVGKRELMRIVWPDAVVADTNLTVHVSALRRALGDGQAGNRYILNIPGRGYRFVAPVTLAEEPRPPTPRLAPPVRPHNLPAQLTRLIGRDEVVSNLLQQLSMQRLITIVGPGGIGKTAVALDLAARLIGAYEHGVWLIDLAPIADPRLVSTTLASVLGAELRSDDPLPGLIAAVRDKQMLLMLDNCEHVIDATARLAAGILRGSRGVQIVATSREPLLVEGERVHRLRTLESPPVSDRLSAAEAIRFPAVQLFVQRATATISQFELSDEDAPSAADICRTLDGIPLAIEFAAARVDAFGVRGVARRLDNRLRLLTGGGHASIRRHRTISAALDWSYQLLSREEQTVFRRLAIFADRFTLESARAVAAGSDGSALDITVIVTSLVMKSLVAADVGHGEVRYRLLETMRAYALAKLEENGEAEALGRHHATYYRHQLEAAGNNSAGTDAAATYAPEINDIRAALSWAFAPRGDRSIAVALAAASAPIWFELSLLTECHSRTKQALDLLDITDQGTRREMVLQTMLGLSLMYTQGSTGSALTALTRASELAESVQEPTYQLRALTGLAFLCVRLEDFRSALVLARRVEAIAKGISDAVALSTADCIIGFSLFSLGEYAEALIRSQRVHRLMTPGEKRTQIVRSGMDYSILARCIVAQVLWLQGLLDQSAQASRDILEDAEAGGHPASLCQALGWCGCRIPLRLGDLETAERSIARLKDVAEKNGLRSYYAFGLGFEGLLSAKRGDSAGGALLLRACVDALRGSQYENIYTSFLSVLAEVLAMAGDCGESLAAADEALARIERSHSLWCMPEALRIRGEALALSDKVDTTRAEDHFRRSLDLARRQGALTLELRAAISLARLWRDRGCRRESAELLVSIYGRFSEGFETADLQTAKRLLDQLT